MSGQKDKRTLIVTGFKPISPIKTKSGGETTLYEVFAKKENGEIVEEALRSFTELETDVAMEYDVSRYDHPRHGTSYTISPPPRNTQGRLREVEYQMEHLLVWAQEQGFKLPEKVKPEGVTTAKDLDGSPPADTVEAKPLPEADPTDAPVVKPPEEQDPLNEAGPDDPLDAPRDRDLDERWGDAPPEGFGE